MDEKWPKMCDFSFFKNVEILVYLKEIYTFCTLLFGPLLREQLGVVGVNS